MKKNIFLVLLFQLCIFGLVAQKDTIYLDSDGKITIKGFETFYRVCNFDLATKYAENKFIDYYANSDIVYATGCYKDSNRSGLFTVYNYDNLKNNSILYTKDGKIDTIYIYQENGKDLMLKFSILNKTISIFEWNDSNGTPLIVDGKGRINFQNKLFSLFGNIKEGKPTGDWKLKTLYIILIESFRNGVFISGEGKKQNGEKFQTNTSNFQNLFTNLEYFENSESLLVSDFYRMRDYPRLHKIFAPRWTPHPQTEKGMNIIESQAVFPGGIEKLRMYLQQQISYPEDAKRNNIKGNVIISFTVDVDGQIKNPKVINGLGYGCDEAAVELVKNMPDWIPGQQKGTPVPVIFKLPIKYE